jgi:two-component system LytT family sensor kinase
MRDELRRDTASIEPRDIILPMIAGCGVYALFRIAQTTLLAQYERAGAMTPLHRVVLSVLDGTLMAALTPFAVWASRRFPVDRRHLYSVPAHLLFGAIISGLTMSVMRGAGQWLTGVPPVLRFAEYYFVWIPGGLAAYAVIVAVAHAMLAARRAQAEELRASRLDAQLSLARLETLKAQLQPHFLFNTLHTISELVHTDPRSADAMIIALGQLLRRTLDASMLEEVTVAEEMEYISAYLDIHRARHHERLKIAYAVDPGVRGARVPPLILQPLVENALRHGIAASARGGTITLRAHADAGRLTLAVHDDGAGLAPTPREGVGLSNTRKRLAELFGSDQTFELRAVAPSGAEAILTIPLR